MQCVIRMGELTIEQLIWTIVGYVTGYNRNTTDDMVILKYDSGGALDGSFGTGGVVVYDGGGTDYGRSIALDSANGIYVAGESIPDMAIWKYK